MQRGALILMFLTLIGCGGPKSGSVLEVRKSAVLFLDEPLFRTSAAVVRAGGKPGKDSEGLARSLKEGKWRILYPGSRVRVLDREEGGLKVFVETAMDEDLLLPADQDRIMRDRGMEGKVGWILANDLK